MIYDAALNPDGWPAVLERISDLVGGGPGSLFLAAPQLGLRYTPVRVGESALIDYAAHYRHQDFMQPALARAAVGALVLDEQVLPRDEQERLAFTNEWVRPNGVGGCVHAVLHRAPGCRSSSAFPTGEGSTASR